VDNLTLLLGNPIPLDKENGIFVYQPKIGEISAIGEDAFQKMTIPFQINLDTLFEDEEDIANNDVFSLFFLKFKSGEYALSKFLGVKDTVSLLIDCIMFFTHVEKEDIMILPQRRKIAIKEKYVIDKDSFEDFRSIVKKITKREDIKANRPPKNLKKRQRDIWEKLTKGRQRKALKDAIFLPDLINVVSFGGRYHIPISEIREMTFFQLSNAYGAVMAMDSYATNMGYKLSPNFKVEEKIDHWQNLLRIGK
jgi:hypothetical protein